VRWFYHQKQNANAPQMEACRVMNFCRDCLEYQTCNHSYGKVHPAALYVYRYLSEIEKGFVHYPAPGSWEYQQEWFITLLSAAQNELESLRAKKG